MKLKKVTKPQVDLAMKTLLQDKISKGTHLGVGHLTWAMAEICRLTGVRPIEIADIEVRRTEGQTEVRVDDAKATGHGGSPQKRSLFFQDPDMRRFRHLSDVAEIIQNFQKSCGHLAKPRKEMVSMAQRHLYEVSRNLFSGKRRLTFYSFRFTLIAEMKAAGISSRHLAALLGHSGCRSGDRDDGASEGDPVAGPKVPDA